MSDYYNNVPELGEAQYEAERAMMEANIGDLNTWFTADMAEDIDDDFGGWVGDNCMAIENAAMNRDEESYEPARQAHLLGAR